MEKDINNQGKSKGEKKLKVLFLTPRFIYPTIGGDRVKPYFLLKHLAKVHDVTLVSFNQGGIPPKSYVREVEKLGVKLITIPLNPFVAGFSCLTRLFTKFPLEILYYFQKEYTNAVNKLFENEKYDIAFAFFMRTAEYIRKKDIKKVLIAEDCRTMYQTRSYQASSNFIQKAVRYWEAKKLEKYEPELVNYFNATTLVTQTDIEGMKQRNDNVFYRLLTNGTDIDQFKPDAAIEREGIIFTGRMDLWANQMMVSNIVDNILPEINKKVPESSFTVVGGMMPANIKSMKCKNIKIHSDVPEMHPYLQKAQVFLHPHTGASGIQNKLLEAMACGCPVVTTKTGNQGIDAVHGESILIGKTNEELASLTIKLLSDKEFAAEIGKNARKHIENKHSWQEIYRQVDSIIDDVMNGKLGK